MSETVGTNAVRRNTTTRTNMKFRDYQTRIINEGTNIINQYGLLYLAMEVRTGKTLTSLGICQRMGVDRVLFLTKRKLYLV